MDFHVMDLGPVVIGSNSRNGRKVSTSSVANRPQNEPKPYRESIRYKRHKAMGTVEIQVDGVTIGEIELRTLVRFSKAAAIRFPKPSTSNGVLTNPADQQEKKVLNLDDSRFWRLPSPSAVQHVLDWMRNARSTPRGDIPPTCAVPEFSDADFVLRCEVYAATILFHIRPPQIEAIGQLMKHVTNTPPTLEMLQTVHELLPIDDVVMTRTITSYFEHVEPHNYRADQKEDLKIQGYVTDAEIDFELFKRFEEIQNARAKRRSRQERRVGAEGEAGNEQAACTHGYGVE